MDSIQRAAEEIGFDTRPYSGRGMFGKSCLGITCEETHKALVAIISQLHESGELDSSTFETLETVRWDNMGLDFIMYFPYIQFCDDDEYEDESDDEDDENDHEKK